MKYIKTFDSIDNIDKLNTSLIIYSSNKSSLNIFRELLNKGADPNCVDSRGYPPIFKTINKYWYSGTELLIKYGADVNKKSPDGLTSFLYLSYHAKGYSYMKHKKAIDNIVKLLIDNGANIYDKNNNLEYFDDLTCKDFVEYIKNTYPEKYNDFIMRKESEKYNL